MIDALIAGNLFDVPQQKTDKTGNARPALDIVAHQVLTAYHVMFVRTVAATSMSTAVGVAFSVALRVLLTSFSAGARPRSQREQVMTCRRPTTRWTFDQHHVESLSHFLDSHAEVKKVRTRNKFA